MIQDDSRPCTARGVFNRNFVGCLIVGAGAVALVMYVTGASSRVAQSYHGLHHSAYVVQILNGILPPTNPSSLGEPANFYWAWHALLAVGVRLARLSPFEANQWLNALSLATALSVMWVAAGRYVHALALRAGLCLLPLVILNPLGPFLFMLQWIGLAAPETAASFTGADGPFAPLALMPVQSIFGVGLSPRAGHLLNKFFNFSSFPCAFALFTVALATLTTDSWAVRVRLPVLVIAGALTALFSPFPGVGLLIVAAAFVGVHLLEFVKRRGGGDAPGSREPIRELIRELLPAGALALGVLLVLPYVAGASQAYGASLQLHLAPDELLRHGLALGWALLPALPIYLVTGLRFSRLSRATRVHWLAGVGLGIPCLFVSFPAADPNEYKLVLLSSVPTSLLLAALLERGSRRSLGVQRLVATGLLLAAIPTLASMVLIYRSSSWASHDPYVERVGGIDLRSDAGQPRRQDLRRAYRWLREETPVTAFVAQLPVEPDELELSVIAERRVVAALPSGFSQAIPYQARLAARSAALVQQLGACGLAETQLTLRVQQLVRLPASWPKEIYALASWTEPGIRPDACRQSLGKGIVLVHVSQHYGVFKLELPSP